MTTNRCVWFLNIHYVSLSIFNLSMFLFLGFIEGKLLLPQNLQVKFLCLHEMEWAQGAQQKNEEFCGWLWRIQFDFTDRMRKWDFHSMPGFSAGLYPTIIRHIVQVSKS